MNRSEIEEKNVREYQRVRRITLRKIPGACLIERLVHVSAYPELRFNMI